MCDLLSNVGQQGLGENISSHIISSTVVKNNDAIVVGFVDIVVADCDVFGLRMESHILNNLNGRLVVIVE